MNPAGAPPGDDAVATHESKRVSGPGISGTEEERSGRVSLDRLWNAPLVRSSASNSKANAAGPPLFNTHNSNQGALPPAHSGTRDRLACTSVPEALVQLSSLVTSRA